MSSGKKRCGGWQREVFALVLFSACGLSCLGGWILDGQPVAPAGGGTNTVASADDEKFPVLRLEMGGPWTDFELRASTNNFTNEVDMVYYIRSWGPTACPDDTNVWIYFLDDCSTNPLRWIKSAYSNSIQSQLADPTNSEVSYVAVCPSRDGCVVNPDTWMSKTNKALVWSFVRADAIGLQSNAAGTRAHQNLTVPVEWRRERIAP